VKVGDLVASTLDGEIGIVTERIPHPTTRVMSYRVWWTNPDPVCWSLEIEPAPGTDLEIISASR
jgi:hypothetical protein